MSEPVQKTQSSQDSYKELEAKFYQLFDVVEPLAHSHVPLENHFKVLSKMYSLAIVKEPRKQQEFLETFEPLMLFLAKALGNPEILEEQEEYEGETDDNYLFSVFERPIQHCLTAKS
jgi:hypothetical protein